jgi:archaellum biogenesis protein FlaJ (TadC family)
MYNEKKERAIMNLTYLLHVLLAGVETSLTPKAQPKYDLRKKKTIKEQLYEFLEDNFIVFAYVIMIIAIAVLIWVAIWMCGVSAVESGAMRNFINGGHI